MRTPGRVVIAAAIALALLARPAVGKPGEKDWIDSPLIGQGDAPANTTTKIFFSAYLDRLLVVEEQEYKFSATFLFYLTWIDPEAPAAVANATADASKPGGDCARYCDNTRVPGDGALCCATLFMPSLILRNVDEYPQGRPQPTVINVSPEGAVSWRSMVRADMYTTLDEAAFPFDKQTLDYHFSINSNTSAGGAIEVVPSAAGLRLFTNGKGDDASGWVAQDLDLFTSAERYPDQFDDKQHPNLVRSSHADDPAPLVPVSGRPAFGEDINVTSVTMVLSVKRLSLFYGVSIILPVVVCTLIAFLVLFIDPDRIGTRLQICITLFLALVAVQWIAEGSLPRASYIIPTRSLVILSYTVLLLIAVETVIVYNLANRHAIKAYHERMRAARDAHAAWARGAAKSARGADRLRTSISLAVSRLPAPGERTFTRPWSRKRTLDKSAPTRDAVLHGAGPAPVGSLDACPESGAPLPPTATQADMERGYNAWLAYVVDKAAFWTILILYLLAGILIFVVASASAPDVCALAGVEDSIQCKNGHKVGG